jgi:hypothetical protein
MSYPVEDAPARLSMDPLEVTGGPFFIQSGVVGASISLDGTLAYVDPGRA